MICGAPTSNKDKTDNIAHFVASSSCFVTSSISASREESCTSNCLRKVCDSASYQMDKVMRVYRMEPCINRHPQRAHSAKLHYGTFSKIYNIGSNQFLEDSKHFPLRWIATGVRGLVDALRAFYNPRKAVCLTRLKLYAQEGIAPFRTQTKGSEAHLSLELRNDHFLIVARDDERLVILAEFRASTNFQR